MLNSLFVQTSREKGGTVDGVNLFFGALLGANLGSLNGVGLFGYTMMVVLIGGAVMALRVVSTSERRLYALSVVAFYVFAFAFILYAAPKGVKGLDPADRDRLAVTLGVWLATVLMVELYPVREVPLKDPPASVPEPSAD